MPYFVNYGYKVIKCAEILLEFIRRMFVGLNPSNILFFVDFLFCHIPQDKKNRVITKRVTTKRGLIKMAHEILYFPQKDLFLFRFNN